MKPKLNDLYAILRHWAMGKGPQTYGDLSRAYYARTGKWFAPRGCWCGPLGELDNRLASIGAPAISALVILKDAKEPGGRFWGCAPNVPERPQNEKDRLKKWNSIVAKVRAYAWPKDLPA